MKFLSIVPIFGFMLFLNSSIAFSQARSALEIVELDNMVRYPKEIVNVSITSRVVTKARWSSKDFDVKFSVIFGSSPIDKVAVHYKIQEEKDSNGNTFTTVTYYIIGNTGGYWGHESVEINSSIVDEFDPNEKVKFYVVIGEEVLPNFKNPANFHTPSRQLLGVY